MRRVDLVLRGGVIHDGTGAAGRVGDIGVRHGRMVLDPEWNPDATVIDVSSRVIAPGFVDIHTHSDLTLLSAPAAPSKVRQGVTTEVVGNCGLGVAPVGDVSARTPDHHEIRAAAGYLDLDPGVAINWTDIEGYLARVVAARPAINVATFVPHNPVRAAVLGFGQRTADAAQRATLVGLVESGLDQGAVGVSTGLVYPPARYADDAELLALGRAVSGRGGLFAWHVRGYDETLATSVAQAIAVARRTGCRTQISHLTAVGRRNWGSVEQVLDEVDRANSEGCDIGVDIYPYLAGNAPLSQLLPAEIQEGGGEPMRERLATASARGRVAEHWRTVEVHWSDLIISAVPVDVGAFEQATVLGRTLDVIAEQAGLAAEEVAMDLLQRYGHGVQMVAFGRDERDLRRVLAHPTCVVASDGMVIDPTGVTGAAGMPHPRSFGCFPRFLTDYCTDLADGIRRCTSAPADRVGLSDRGRIADGLPADLVVLDPSALGDTATYQQSKSFPTGVDLVMVGGEIVVHDGSISTARPGRVLTPTGSPRPGVNRIESSQGVVS